MIYIGIDPGVGGGIAQLDDDGSVLDVRRMPGTEQDILDALHLHDVGSGAYTPTTTMRAMLERVRSSPQMGVVSVFTFGCGYGGLRMALTAVGIPFDEVTPQRWQKEMSCMTKGDKNVSKRRAQDLFPSVKVTLAIADALLLAEYCRREHR